MYEITINNELVVMTDEFFVEPGWIINELFISESEIFTIKHEYNLPDYKNVLLDFTTIEF